MRSRLVVSLAVLVVAIPSAAHAAEVGRRLEPLTPSVTQPETPASLEQEKLRSVLPTPALPQSPASTPGGPTITPHTITIVGNSVLDQAAIDSIVAAYRDRPLDNRSLHDLTEALSRAYLDAGFINSGVIVPDQQLDDGVLVLQVIEGELTDIQINGETRLNENYIVERVRRHISFPLQLGDVRESIVLLQRDPNIERVDAHISPGVAAGEARLGLSMQESSPLRITTTIDNHQSEAIGAERIRVGVSHSNLTGRGDAFALELGVSDGADLGAVAYEYPLLSGTSLRAYYSLDDTDVVEDPFEVLDITTKTERVGIAVVFPWLEAVDESLSITVGAELARSRSRLGGERFSLSSGAVDGRSAVSVAILGADWVRRGPTTVLAVRATVRHGFDVFGATDAERTQFDPSGIDGSFTSFLLQGQYIARLTDTTNFTARLTTQVADDGLLGMEKLAIGGVNTVRGYRENLLVRDNGLATTLEVAWRPFTDTSTSWLEPLRDLTALVFLDYGRSWDKEDVDTTSVGRDTTDGRYIASAGVGMRWQPVRSFNAAIYWGEDIADNFDSDDNPVQASAEHGLQDDGLHFSITWAMNF